jgi:hypothetical protein
MNTSAVRHLVRGAVHVLRREGPGEVAALIRDEAIERALRVVDEIGHGPTPTLNPRPYKSATRATSRAGLETAPQRVPESFN